MLTDLELTVLSIIAEGQRYGHEIESAIRERGLHQWVMVGSSSLIYVITKLQHSALIESLPQSVDQRAYGITEAGRAVLQTAIIDRLRSPNERFGIEIALAALRSLKPAQVYGALLRRHAELRAALAEIDSLISQSSTQEPTDLHAAMQTHRAAILRAEIEWLNGFMAAWRARYPASDSAPEHAADQAATAAHTALHSPTEKQNPRERAKKLQTIRRGDEGNQT